VNELSTAQLQATFSRGGPRRLFINGAGQGVILWGNTGERSISHAEGENERRNSPPTDHPGALVVIAGLTVFDFFATASGFA